MFAVFSSDFFGFLRFLGFSGFSGFLEFWVFLGIFVIFAFFSDFWDFRDFQAFWGFGDFQVELVGGVKNCDLCPGKRQCVISFYTCLLVLSSVALDKQTNKWIYQHVLH